MIEIRPATPDEMPQLARVVSRALAIPVSSFRDLRPEMTLCVFEDDRLATVHGSWPLTMRLNGRSVPISGVTTVATDPLDRGRGFLRLAVERHFRELRERGERPLAVLYASQAAIYHRFGYAVVSTHHRYQVEPRYLQFVEPLTVPGRLREVDPDREFPLLVELYRRYREDKTGYVHRGRAMWQAGVLAPPERAGHEKVVVCYEEEGEALGYLVYSTGPGPFEGPEPNQLVTVSELAALTPAAYQAFWELLARMHLARFIEWPTVPGDDPLPHLLAEPRMLRDTARDGLLARIVDLPAALSSRGYDAEGELVLEVPADALCPWNDGRWRLEVGAGEVRVTAASGEADLRMGIRALAMLLFGQRSATELVRMGLAEGRSEAVARADRIFATRRVPFSPDRW